MIAKKKPVIINYFPIIINTDETDNLTELEIWVQSFGDNYKDHFSFIDQGPDGASLKVKTLEGISYEVTTNDVVIRGVKGEYYPCKKDIFEQTYDKL